MDQQELIALEYDRVIRLLSEQAVSQPGKKLIRHLQPSVNPEEVRRWLQETAEGQDLLRIKGNVSLGGIRDIEAAIQRAEMSGLLSAEELLDISRTITAGKRFKQLMSSLEDEEYPLPILRDLAERIEGLGSLQGAIDACIDEEAEIVDHASPELLRVRRGIHQVQQQIRTSLDQMLRNSQVQKMVQESIITLRNNRYVLPIKQEYRGAFAGIVHDTSASGATLFIEPEVVVTLNNQLRELELAEAKEVERILFQLTAQVGEHAEALKENLSLLAQLDLIMAKAHFGQEVRGICPDINDQGIIRLKQARHPLIPAAEVVPIDVELGESYHGIVITGPNTGGKTVSLKTVGLLALMSQSGLPIPAEAGSTLPVFSGIYADIGDEQSIEQNLSTFSSHMTHIIRILDRLDNRSLVLLDELGAGTDPAEGAALATAILDQVLDQGCRLIATTHYSELKLYAHAREGLINASVEFDVESLRPTYRLLIGVPGRSNAFAIASRLGLSDSIIESAKAQLSAEENRLEEMIRDLTLDQKATEKEREQAESLRREAEAMHRELQEKIAAWEKEKERLYQSARQEARSLLARSRAEADEVLRQLREWNKQRPDTLKEHQLIEAKKRLDEALPDFPAPTVSRGSRTDQQEIAAGDEVFVATVNQKGNVVEVLGDGEFLVQIGVLRMKVHQDRLERLGSGKKETKEASPKASLRLTSKTVRPELDLRGKLVEEAIAEIDKYLDDAVLAGYQQVSLIHGKGTGALRNGVQKYLRTHPNVANYRMGGLGEGGSGVTLVSLK